MTNEYPGVFTLKVGILFLSLISIRAYASEFSHLRLNPQFEDYITKPRNSTKAASHHALNAKSEVGLEAADAAVAQRFRQAVFGNSNAELKSDWSSPFPADGEESPLYEEIRRHLDAAHEDIGRSQVSQLNLLNRQFDLGTQNFSGFSWQKPFGVIQVYADRQVTPNLFGENWLVQDTFVFEIEAATFLEKLADSGLLIMNGVEIGAFAGLTFKRAYTYYHYADSYQGGLAANFTKLFLPFLLFDQHGVEKMLNDEIMKREDFWSVRAGGTITGPPYYGFSASGCVLAELAYQRTTTAQSTHNSNPDAQRYRLSVNAKKSAMAGATASLQLDFFKLIKFTLLNFEFQYEYAKAQEYSLAFNSLQWDEVKTDNLRGREMRKILRGFGEVNALGPFVARLDESSSSSLQARGSILLWGKLKKNKTEQIRVINDGKVRTFFKNYAQSVKVVQNFFSRIFSAVAYKLLKFPIGTSNAAMYNRQINMEYEATHPQASDPKISRIENTAQFSFVLNQSYEAARTDRWIDKRFKNDVIWFVGQFTTLSKDYKTNIRSELLKGPLRVESNLRVEKAGLDYLLATSDDGVWEKIALVCGSKKIAEWNNTTKRQARLKKLLVGSEACVKKIGSKFAKFKSDYLANSLMPSLKKFKDFLGDYYKKAQSLDALSELFGAENTFIHGRLQATTSRGNSFVTTFSSGQFRGLGVINNFKRATGSRTPAAIPNE